MKITRKTGNKKLKKFCIYVWQEKKVDGSVDTYVDHVGDQELYEEFKKNIKLI